MDSADPTSPEMRLWLSATVLPPEGGAIVMCLVNDTETEFGTGLGGRFEKADEAGWTFQGSFSASPAYWNSLGTVWIGPHSGLSPAIGFTARPGEIGQAEYLLVPPLEPGRYRFWHQDGPGSPVGPDESPKRAYGELEVSKLTSVLVPVEIKNASGAGMLAYPPLLPPSGGRVSIQGFTPERVHKVFPIELHVQRWAAGKWDSPSLSLTPRELSEYPFGPAVDFPVLPAGPYRLSCEHPDLGDIGRVIWVVEGLPGMVGHDE